MERLWKNMLSQLRSGDTIRCLVLGGLAVVLMTVLSWRGVLAELEYALYDLRTIYADTFTPEPSDQIIHVDIDDSSLEKLGRWPWPRSTLAEAIRALDELGAKTIVLDIIFEDEEQLTYEETGNNPIEVAPGMFEGQFRRVDHTKDLADAMRDAGNVILGLRMRRLSIGEREHVQQYLDRLNAFGTQVTEQDRARISNETGLDRLGIDPRKLLVSSSGAFLRIDPVQRLAEAAAGLGIVNYDAQRTGGRAYELRVKSEFRDGVSYPSLGLEGVRLFLDEPRRSIERADETTFRFGKQLNIPTTRDGHMKVPWSQRSKPGPWLPEDDEDWAGYPKWQKTHQHVPIYTFVERYRQVKGWPEARHQAASIIVSLGMGEEYSGELTDELEARIDRFIEEAISWQFEYETQQELHSLLEQEGQSLSKEMQESEAPTEDQWYTLRMLQACADWVGAPIALAEDSTINTEWAELREMVEGKLVFIGIINTGSAVDIAPTPLGELTPGVIAHAMTANGVLTRHLLSPTPGSIAIITSLILGMCSAFAATLLGPKRSWLALLIIAGGVTLANGGLFDAGNFVIDLDGPLTSIALSYVVCTTYRAIQFRRERAAIKAQFAARVSPQLVDILVDNPDLMNMAGESREITTIFTDFAGFTAVSESLTDQEIVGIINLYLRNLADVLMEEGAYINKFLGDGIMAFWGAPTSTGADATHALRAAVSLFDVMDRVNDDQEKEGFKRLGMRCGMSTGQVIVGDCGAPPRLNDYTVIGDAVNLAARLESAAKQFGAEFLITRRTIDDADPALVEQIYHRPLGKIRVVGQQKGQDIHEVIGWKHRFEADQREEIEDFIAKSTEAVDLFVTGEYEQSQSIWQDLVLFPRGTAGAILYAERCQELIESGAKDEMLPLRSK